MRAPRAIITLAFCIVLAFGPVACRENGSSNEENNSIPAAYAGNDQNVLTGALVTLDGSDSFDVDGDPLTYWWTFTSVPSGSGASLSDPSAVYPTFTADVEGIYVVLMEVNDGTESNFSDVRITVADYFPPTADAGPDLNVIAGSLVALDGSGSSGDSLNYTWKFTSVPLGSGAFLSDSSAVYPTFAADMDGDYVVNLTVYDVTANSASDTVTITAFTKTSSLPDSEQTRCFSSWGFEINCAGTGQDAEYSINPMSYTDNGDGTITDNITDLMWQQEDDNIRYNWYEASGTFDATRNPDTIDVCGALTLGGYSDWRLPNEMELMRIVDYGMRPPAVNATYFPNTNESVYWTSTSHALEVYSGWTVDFRNGVVYRELMRDSAFVRCVRGGTSPSPSFTDNLDGTVTDNNTGLMWQKCNAGVSSVGDCSKGTALIMTWEEALNYCNSLIHAWRSDWRLPNIKELFSIIDSSTFNPAIDATYFPNTPVADYWSSSTCSYWSSNAWLVSFDTSHSYATFTDATLDKYVRCVR